jgi:hypothetical protein
MFCLILRNIYTLREERKLRLEVKGEWKKFHNEELHILYSSPIIIRQVKSRRMRWTGHAARMREEIVQDFGGKARRKVTTWKT